MRRVLVSLCAVVAAVTTGCADGSDGGSDGRARQDPRPPALTWQQELRVADAQQRLTKQCMDRQGFTYREDRGLTLRESRPVRYVQDDVAWARTYGYGGRIEAKSLRVHERNPNGTYRQSLSPARRAAFDAALDGGADARMLTARLPGGGEMRKRVGGCTEEAERALYGDPAEWYRTGKIATGLNALYGEELMKDRHLTAAVRAWSRCMTRAGLPHEDPRRPAKPSASAPADWARPAPTRRSPLSGGLPSPTRPAPARPPCAPWPRRGRRTTWTACATGSARTSTPTVTSVSGPTTGRCASFRSEADHLPLLGGPRPR